MSNKQTLTQMFKFFKELVDSFKEGIEEGKAELAQEKLEEEKQNEQWKKIDDLSLVSYDEKFGTALGAPFRSVFFGDWFTLFKSTEDDEYIPVHLYKFGEYQERERKQNDLTKLMNRDFGITNSDSAKKVLASFFTLGNISKEGTLLEGCPDDTEINWNMDEPSVKALLAVVLSHITTASTDIGYLAKDDALKILSKVSEYAKEYYVGWEDFQRDFLLGEEKVGLNNRVGRSIISKYIGYLNTKKGSPWRNIEWR